MPSSEEVKVEESPLEQTLDYLERDMEVDEIGTLTPPHDGGKPRMRGMARLGRMNIKDHFSLTNPSSHIAFADDEAVVLVDNLEQTTLEIKNDDDFVVVKQATVASPGLMLLRITYTLLALLISSFVFICCTQVILFLFLGLAVSVGEYDMMYHEP